MQPPGCSLWVSVFVLLASARGTRPAASTLAVNRIVVHDYAEVAATHMQSAVAQLHAIFSAAGVETQVIVERRRPNDAGLALAAADDRVARDPAIMGMVPAAGMGGRLAYVFAARVEIAAKRRQSDYGMLLGMVLAHEVGHVLLGRRGHTATGVMRPLCDSRQIRAGSLGRLSFTSDEAAEIHHQWDAQ